MICHVVYGEQEVLHLSMETVVGFLLPYGIIVSSYVCILRHLRQTQFKRRVRSEKLILAIIIIFAAFWLPYHIINIMQVRNMERFSTWAINSGFYAVSKLRNINTYITLCHIITQQHCYTMRRYSTLIARHS